MAVLILFGVTNFSGIYKTTKTGMRAVTDLSGKIVNIPNDPQRIACYFGPSMEKVFMLGYADRVVAISTRQTPWAYKIYPRMKDIEITRYYTDPDIEKILKTKIDLAFYWNWPAPRAKLEAAGIPAVCPMNADKPVSANGFLENYKKEIRFYAGVLGRDAVKKAEKYCRYFDKKISNVLSATSGLKDHEKPFVYFSDFDELKTQGKHSTAYWFADIAGGRLVSAHMGSHYIDVSLEQVIKWNPDIIFVTSPDSFSRINENKQWSTIRAVRNNKVFIVPAGFFHANHGSTDTVILVMHMAKTMHGNYFPDMDMIKEIKYFYGEFYNYSLNDSEADRLLHHLDPEI